MTIEKKAVSEKKTVTPADLMKMVLEGGNLSALDLALPPDATLHGLDAPPRVTSSLRQMLGKMEYAVQRRSPITLITGTHGGGKSTAARIFAAARKDVLLLETKPKINERTLMADLVDRLGLTTGQAVQLRTDAVLYHLKQHPRIFIFDEAQRMTRDPLDQLKYLADNSGSQFVLMGSPWLNSIVNRQSDISSRVWVRCEIHPLPLDEFRVLYAEDGFTGAVLDEIHALTGGVLRLITALIAHLDAALAAQTTLTRQTLTVAHVRKAAEVVI